MVQGKSIKSATEHRESTKKVVQVKIIGAEIEDIGALRRLIINLIKVEKVEDVERIIKNRILLSFRKCWFTRIIRNFKNFTRKVVLSCLVIICEKKFSQILFIICVIC